MNICKKVRDLIIFPNKDLESIDIVSEHLSKCLECRNWVCTLADNRTTRKELQRNIK